MTRILRGRIHPILALVALLAAWPVPAAGSAPAPTPSVTASSAVLIDLDDGAVLWSKDPDRRLPPASAVKIMTALVVLERSSPDEMVIVSAAAERVGERDPEVIEVDLRAGERFTVEELLYALLLPSANDAAVALAEHVGGSVEAFTAMMNSRAQRLGARSSNFTNPHGLDHPGQRSTARDLAAIAREAMMHRGLFRRIVGTYSYMLERPGGSRVLINRNRLLRNYPGAIGIKTGTTTQAGEVLVSGARRGGEGRVAVVMGSSDRYPDSARMLDHGFLGFARLSAADAGEAWGYATFGDGTTRLIVAKETLSVLVQTGAGRPEVLYDHSGNMLEIAAAPGNKEAAAIRRCLESPCRQPGPTRNLVVAFWEGVGPLLRWLSLGSR